jgi:rhodanese-related sulfurtransferase
MPSLYDQGLSHPDGYRDIDVSLLAAVLSSPHARLVDVREPEELRGPLGHIAGVQSVPLPRVEAVAAAWPRGEDVVLICRSGGRSGRAAAQLTRLGFVRVMNLRGGMLAWNEARLPVVRPPEAQP